MKLALHNPRGFGRGYFQEVLFWVKSLVICHVPHPGVQLNLQSFHEFSSVCPSQLGNLRKQRQPT